MTDVLAIDLATATGWARGSVGEVPRFASIIFAKDKKDNNAVFAGALRWIMGEVRNNPPDVLMMEALLPPSAMINHTSRAVRDRLAGLHGIVRAVAKDAGVDEIATASVGDVRNHFIGTRMLQREPAKRAVIERCRALEWQVKNDNEGDACAIWSFACSILDPRQALLVSPLFNKNLRVSTW
jgi:hypothetical protein